MSSEDKSTWGTINYSKLKAPTADTDLFDMTQFMSPYKPSTWGTMDTDSWLSKEVNNEFSSEFLGNNSEAWTDTRRYHTLTQQEMDDWGKKFDLGQNMNDGGGDLTQENPNAWKENFAKWDAGIRGTAALLGAWNAYDSNKTARKSFHHMKEMDKARLSDARQTGNTNLALLGDQRFGTGTAQSLAFQNKHKFEQTA